MFGKAAKARIENPSAAAGVSEHPLFQFDRTAALGVGVFIGLSTVLAERFFPPRPLPKAAPPLDRSPMAIARRTLKEFDDDRIPAVAAGATFFALLSLFPALGVLVSLYGLFGSAQDLAGPLDHLAGLLPAGALSVIGDQLSRLTASPPAKLGMGFAVSLLLSLWSVNAGMKAVIQGLTVAYEEPEKRGFVALNLVSFGLTLGATAVVLAAILAMSAAPSVMAPLGLQGWVIADWLRWPAMVVVGGLAISTLYRYAPARHRPDRRWITVGGVAAAVAWTGMSALFSVYVANFGTYDRTYGSLGALAGFMTWIWLSLIVVLLGAELNSELERVN